MTSPSAPIAIVGAGITGLSLALTLAQSGIRSQIFESRSRTATSAGALMLSPNALRILDTLSVYNDIRTQGYEFVDLVYKNEELETVDRYDFGGKEKYGYYALRIYRSVLLDALRANVEEERLIEVRYGAKFEKVVSEDDEGIRFVLEGGEVVHTALLVGADGIHSKVRRMEIEDVKAAYVGLIGVTGAVETAKIGFPKTQEKKDSRVPYPLPASFSESQGAFVLAPQDPEAKESLAGVQMPYPALDRAGWDALGADKPKLLSLLKKDFDKWSPMVQSAMNAIDIDSLYVWPFHTMPKIDSWISKKCRIVLAGDAAHAVPPTAGQGASQGLEDAFSLGALISRIGVDRLGGSTQVFSQTLHRWQNYRQARVDRVLDLTDTLNKRRVPGWKGDKAISVDWLYNVDIKTNVEALFAS